MLKTSRKCTLILVFAFAVLFTVCCDAMQKYKCGKHPECVMLKSRGGQLLMDELDLKEHTVDTLINRLPSWFGPARPVVFMFDGSELKSGIPLVDQGVESGHVLTMHSEFVTGEAEKDL